MKSEEIHNLDVACYNCGCDAWRHLSPKEYYDCIVCGTILTISKDEQNPKKVIISQNTKAKKPYSRKPREEDTEEV